MLKISFVLLSVFISVPTSLFAQSVPQFIARRDIQLDGQVVVQAGDLINSVEVAPPKVTIIVADGKRAVVDRADLADTNEAIDVLATLIGKNPKEARLYSSRSNIWAIKKDFPKAIEDATQAINSTEPKDAILYVNRGVFYSSHGDYAKATADYIEATHINPSFYAAYQNLVSAHIAQKEFDKAIDICNQIIKVNGSNPEHYVRRGVAFRHLEQWDNAVADFSKAIELKNDHLPALGSRGFVYYLRGEYAEAVKDFDAIIKVNPNDVMAYNNRGYNSFLAGDCKSALTDFDKAISLLPTYAAAYQNKAWMLATCIDDEVRNGKAALEAAEKAIEQRKERQHPDIKALAAAYAETGDFASAVTHQTEVLSMVSDDQKPAEEEILAAYQAENSWRTKTASATE